MVSLVDKNSTQLWSAHPTDLIFKDYVIESIDHNQIILELNIDSLYRAIRSYNFNGRGIDGVHFRLKKQGKTALLSISFEQASSSGSDAAYVRHAFPVRLVRKDESNAIEEPQCPPPDLYLLLPNPLSEINKLVENFRSLGSHVTVRINRKGHIAFEVDGDGLRIETTYKNGTIVEAEDEPDGDSLPSPAVREQDDDYDPRVVVNVKDLSNVLQITNVVKRIVIGICNEYAIILYCYLDRTLPDDENENEDQREEVLTYYMSHLDL